MIQRLPYSTVFQFIILYVVTIQRCTLWVTASFLTSSTNTNILYCHVNISHLLLKKLLSRFMCINWKQYNGRQSAQNRMTELDVIKLVSQNPLTGFLERIRLMLEMFLLVNSLWRLSKTKSSLNVRIRMVINTECIKKK
jgi:hypothetical protein